MGSWGGGGRGSGVVSETRSRCVLAVVVCVLAVVVLGCSHQEFSRPALRRPATMLSDLFDSGKPYVEPGPSPTQRRMERLAQALAAWQAEAPREAPDYLIGPGDRLEVRIFALEAPNQTHLLKRTVSQDGYVTLPWVESVPAAGLSCRQLEGSIGAAYAGRYLKDPQVAVTVSEYRSCAVVVTGAVRRAGVYYLSTNRSTVLAVLAEAGGLRDDAGDELLVVRSGAPGAPGSQAGPTTPMGGQGAEAVVELVVGEGVSAPSAGVSALTLSGVEARTVTIDLEQLLDEGNLLLNLEVCSGDVITVPPRVERYVYVLGYVQRPGAFKMQDGVRVNALRAVALAGGLTETARAENSFLVRETAAGQRVVPVDLTKIARGVRPPLYLESGDTLVVGSSFMAKLTEFVRPTVRAGMQFNPGQ